MARALVPADQLLDILNQRLQKRVECTACVVVGPIRRLDALLPDGGNWNRSITVRGRPSNPHACGEAAHEVVDDVAQEFNLL
jgi:hypothetical protein